MQDIKTIFYFAPSLTEYQSRWTAGEISPRTIVFVPPTAEGDSGLIYKGGIVYGKATDDSIRNIVIDTLNNHPEILPIAGKYNNSIINQKLGCVVVGNFLNINAAGTLSVDKENLINDSWVVTKIKNIIGNDYLKTIINKEYIESLVGNLDPSELLPATTERLGGIKVGTYLEATTSGVLSVKIGEIKNALLGDSSFLATVRSGSLPTARTDAKGGIKIGKGFNMTGDDNEILNINDNYIKNLINTENDITVATASKLGGIKLFNNNTQLGNKNYLVILDGENRAYVHVPWEGSINPGGTSGEQKVYFTNITAGLVPETPTTAECSGDSFTASDNKLWSKTNVNPSNNLDTYAIWAWFKDNACVSIYGPVKIFSNGTSSNGEDGEEIEWIYTRTNTKWSDSDITTIGGYLSSYTGTTKIENTATIGGYVWTNHPTGIDSDHKYEYASFRVSTNVNGKRTWSLSRFSNPVLWSAYGEQGTDGDGVEYIYFVGASVPSGTMQDPTTWAASQNPEFKGPEGAGWTDDPSDLTIQGQKQWVSVRKKQNGEWGTFSTPALWSYFAQDGVVDGYTVNVINENMPVNTAADGSVTLYGNTCWIEVFHNAERLTWTDTAGNPSAGFFKVSVGTIVRSEDLNNAASGISVGTLSADSGKVKIPVSILNISNFAGKNAYIPITVQLPGVDNTRQVMVTLYGITVGEPGQSYDLWTSVNTIHSNYNSTVVSPSNISVGLKIGNGTDEYERQVLGTNTIKSGFSFQYFYDDSSAITALSTQHPTIPVEEGNHEKITILMLYTVDAVSTVVDSEVIWYVRDGQPGIDGLTPDQYDITVKNTTVTVDENNNCSGAIEYYIHLNGHEMTSIPEGWTLTALIGGVRCDYTHITGRWWVSGLPNTISYVSGTTPAFSSIVLKDDVNTVKASVIVPFIIKGPKGDTGPQGSQGPQGDSYVQPLEHPVIRLRGEWNNSAVPVYNDGSSEHAEDGVRYIDVVSKDGFYYKCVRFGTTSNPSQDTPDWERFSIASDTAFNTLIANNAYINSLTSKQVVVTNNSNIPVGGMVSGNSIPTLLGDRTNNNGIRIFAGSVSSTGDISTAPFTVDNDGHVKASSVDIHGNVDGIVSGSFVTTGEGYKLMLYTSDGCAVLKLYHPDSNTHPAEEANLSATSTTGASLNLYTLDWDTTGNNVTSTGSHCELDPNSIKFWNNRTNEKDQVGIQIDSNLNIPKISLNGDTQSNGIVSGYIQVDEINFPYATIYANRVLAKDPVSGSYIDLLSEIKAIKTHLGI